jgi:hypothetical protein
MILAGWALAGTPRFEVSAAGEKPTVSLVFGEVLGGEQGRWLGLDIHKALGRKELFTASARPEGRLKEKFGRVASFSMLGRLIVAGRANVTRILSMGGGSKAGGAVWCTVFGGCCRIR